jgi:hypothetical protein
MKYVVQKPLLLVLALLTSGSEFLFATCSTDAECEAEVTSWR